MTPRAPSPARGIALKVAATAVFTVMAALVRAASDTFPVGQIVFFRSALALVPLLVWLAVLGVLTTALHTRRPLGHLLRTLIGFTAMGSIFLGLAYLPLADATALGYAVPLLTVVFAAVFLKEKVRAYRWWAVAAGFAGVLVMLAPQLGGTRGPDYALGAAFALAGCLFTALAMIQVRRLTMTETTGAIVFYFSLFASLLALMTSPFGWVMPTASQLTLLVMIGLLGGVGQILLTESYRAADASVIAPFEYASMIWAVLLGFALFGEVPHVAVLAGAVIVVASGLYVIWRERGPPAPKT